MLRKFFIWLHEAATQQRKKQIINLLDFQPEKKILDLGCDDGARTMEIANKIGTNEIYGVDIVEDRLEQAKKMGVKTTQTDLNGQLPFENNYFDLIHADQVIEHIAFLDNFASEIYRILKPEGILIISTENGSSWHNIFAAIMGWQIFSSSNLSTRRGGLGNPLAVLRHEKKIMTSWTHKTIFNYRGLKEFWETYNFQLITTRGAGYYPLLPSAFAQIDPRHCHYMTMKFRKKI
jgi:ubiquinone/menaquinone biosynthesis C-methylase UbiE